MPIRALALLALLLVPPQDPPKPPAERILDAALAGTGAVDKLRDLCDRVGHRLSGSPGLERAVEWAQAQLRKDGHENVAAEKVMVPKWVRGKESLVLTDPRPHPGAMLGLGGSVGTPPEGISAEILACEDEKSFEALGDAVKGRIVLFNNRMPPFDPEKGSGYGDTVRFRVNGAALVSKKGGVACLVRSVTARSLRTPHTGMMRYAADSARIPAAAISGEDADYIARRIAAGEKVAGRLVMEAKDEGLAPSANVVAELRGAMKPDEIVVIGGHLDSWDVGQGAHDDGAGVVAAMEALALIRSLGLRPARTIRVVLWTNEENGLAGATTYKLDHGPELAKHVAAIEADSGGFKPLGFGVACSDAGRQKQAAAVLAELLKPLARIGATKVKPGACGADVGPLKDSGVPALGLLNDESTYFDTHHTHADTFDKVNPRELQECAGAMAVLAWALSELPGRLGE